MPSILTPPLALTMGDGAGIGPELCLRLLAEPLWAGRAVIYGSGAVLSRTLDHLSLIHI